MTTRLLLIGLALVLVGCCEQPIQRHLWAYVRYKDHEATTLERTAFEPEEFMFRYDHDKAFRDSIASYSFR